MLIDRALLDELIAHARDEYDAECCGLIACREDASGGEEGQGAPRRAELVRRATNVFASRKRFEIDGKELLRALGEFEEQGLELAAIYHSHTHTVPYPSQTDINFAANWPGLEWVIIGLAEEQPQVRSYLIDGADVKEVELEVR
ncbi:MAG TPA: M67 family metallopeptidase [Solirubrobacteraceae bacterium]|jgi:proteasome lid subunit RPN8/RPN11|nr:M67 family metallopeptidase [Solirubrobacteraceae bacterium]